MRFLSPWLFLLASGFGAVTVGFDHLRFAVGDGKCLGKTFDTTIKLGGGTIEYETTVDGVRDEGERPADDVLFSERTRVKDRYSPGVKEIPHGIHRTYEFARRRRVTSDDKVREGPSALEGEAVLLRWDANEDEYERNLEGEEQNETEAPVASLLESLEIDLDYEFLLPDQDVGSGATWSVPPDKLLNLLNPVGNLYFWDTRPPDRPPLELGIHVHVKHPLAMQVLGIGDILSHGDMVSKVQGNVRAEYKGETEEDERTIGTVAIAGDVLIELDPTSMIVVAILAQLPAGVDPGYDHQLTLEMTGQGELKWDMEQGNLKSFLWRADLAATETADVEFRIEDPLGGKANEVSASVRVTWDGLLIARARVD